MPRSSSFDELYRDRQGPVENASLLVASSGDFGVIFAKVERVSTDFRLGLLRISRRVQCFGRRSHVDSLQSYFVSMQPGKGPSEVVNAVGRRLFGSWQTLQGSFSAISKQNFASKYAFESSCRDLHNAPLCTALRSQFFPPLVGVVLLLAEIWISTRASEKVYTSSY